MHFLLPLPPLFHCLVICFMTVCCWLLEELSYELTWETCFLGFSTCVLAHPDLDTNAVMNFLSAFCSKQFWLLLYVIHFWHKLPCDVLRVRRNIHPHKRLICDLLGPWVGGEDLSPWGLPRTVLFMNTFSNFWVVLGDYLTFFRMN